MVVILTVAGHGQAGACSEQRSGEISSQERSNAQMASSERDTSSSCYPVSTTDRRTYWRHSVSLDRWTAVDAWFEDQLIPADDTLTATLDATEAAQIPAISVSPSQGKFLQILARMQGATRILEIGTLAGYSTIWLARALPEDGQLVTLELDPIHAEVARQNFANAGVAGRIELREGLAVDSLQVMIASGEAPFDFIFIDADKPSNSAYLDAALKLSRPGTVIVLDNVVRNGAVVDPDATDPNVIGVRSVIDDIANNPRLTATAIQTVGSKGYDGFALIHVS